jgi:hypothetical protein
MYARRPICTYEFACQLEQAGQANSTSSKSHKASCKFRERALELQRTCVVCDKDFDEDSRTIDDGRLAEICTLCFGAKYCSAECKDKNAYVAPFELMSYLLVTTTDQTTKR